MHQVKKANERHFGMQMHVAFDASSGLTHSPTTTPAKVHDITQIDQLPHGKKERVWGDAATNEFFRAVLVAH